VQKSNKQQRGQNEKQITATDDMTTQLTTILLASLYPSMSCADWNSLKYMSPASTSTEILQYNNCTSHTHSS